MISNLHVFLLGVMSPIALVAVLWFASRLGAHLTAKTIGGGGCQVCDHYPKWQTGTHTNARYHFERIRHDLLWEWRPWHRAGWRAHRWNRRGTWIEGNASHWISCTETNVCAWLGVRGPYSDLGAAAAVGHAHERAVHGGSETTMVGLTYVGAPEFQR